MRKIYVKMVVKSLTLDKIKQLVDINGDMTNFKALIEINPADATAEYELAFVNQTILDNAEDFDYTSTRGPFRHAFTSSDDMYQNHFVCLRSTSPLDVNINVTVEELPTNTVAPMKPQVEEFVPPPMEPEKIYEKVWFKVLIVVSVLFVIYWFFFRKTPVKQATSEHQRLLSMVPSLPSPPVVEAVPDVVPIVAPIVAEAIVPAAIVAVADVQSLVEPVCAVPDAKSNVVTFSEDVEYKPKNDFTMRLLERLKHK
jgi:hypothetical protein